MIPGIIPAGIVLHSTMMLGLMLGFGNAACLLLDMDIADIFGFLGHGATVLVLILYFEVLVS